MQFVICNRYTGASQFIAEIDYLEAASEPIKIGLAVRWALAHGADLAGANLVNANLVNANLVNANLAGANLAGAYLAGAYLAGAYLAGANFVNANLVNANLAGADLAAALKSEDIDIPVIPAIDAVILAEIERGGTLDMNTWHGPGGWCGTTHCRAGWAVHCAGKFGKALEDRVGTQIAATLIYQKSRQSVPWFFAPTNEALADIRKCAAEQTEAANK